MVPEIGAGDSKLILQRCGEHNVIPENLRSACRGKEEVH